MQKIQRDFKIIDCALLTTQTIILIEFYNFFDSTIIRYLRIYTQSLTFGNRMESKTSYDSWYDTTYSYSYHQTRH